MNTRIAAAALVVMALAVGGFTYYYFHQAVPGTVTGQGGNGPNTVPSTGTTGTPTTAPHHTVIYTVVASGGDENNLAPQPLDLPPTQSPARAVMDALISSPQSPLPSGTRLLDIRLSGGLATLNLSQEFKKNFKGGDEQEAQAMNAILMTLGQFSTIDRVQILVEGNAIDTLGGHFEISGPLDVVRPGNVQQARNDQPGQ